MRKHHNKHKTKEKSAFTMSTMGDKMPNNLFSLCCTAIAFVILESVKKIASIFFALLFFSASCEFH